MTGAHLWPSSCVPPPLPAQLQPWTLSALSKRERGRRICLPARGLGRTHCLFADPRAHLLRKQAGPVPQLGHLAHPCQGPLLPARLWHGEDTRVAVIPCAGQDDGPTWLSQGASPDLPLRPGSSWKRSRPSKDSAGSHCARWGSFHIEWAQGAGGQMGPREAGEHPSPSGLPGVASPGRLSPRDLAQSAPGLGVVGRASAQCSFGQRTSSLGTVSRPVQ